MTMDLNTLTGLFEYRPRRYTTTQPFTYRDTITTLRAIEEIKRNLNAMVECLNDMSSDMDDFEKQVARALELLSEATQKRLEELESRLKSMIEEANRSGTAFSPVRGTVQSLDHVLGDMYDNLRVTALFAVDYDDMRLTAREYDELGFTARRYDLQASAKTNNVPGDFSGRGDLWRPGKDN